MFMGKLELENVKKHLKMRLRDCSGIMIGCILLGVFFVISAFVLVQSICIKQESVVTLNVIVYSDWAMIFMIFIFIYYSLQYYEYCESHQIFPQTNTTRFLAFELYCYIINIILQAVALGLYLINYLLCQVLCRVYDNVHLGYSFSLPFVTAGFFVSLCYGFIIISLTVLISSLVRKFHWWVLGVYVLCISYLFITKDLILISIFNFYMHEPSLIIFFLKAVFTWLVIELLNQLLNRYINVIKAKKYHYPQVIIVFLVLMTLLGGALSAFNYINVNTANDSFWSQINEVDINKDQPVTSVNVGDLKPGSVLYVNLHYDKNRFSNSTVGLTNQTKDQILVYFKPHKEMVNDINITNFTHPKVSVKLEDNNLNISITEDQNVKVISIYPYSTLRWFDCFKDKLYANSESGSYSGTITGDIIVSVPEGMNLDAQLANVY